MNKFTKISALSALALAIATPAFAEGPEGAPPHERDPAKMIERLDVDANGTLSKPEFMAKGAKMFEKMDMNHDGELSVEEFEQAHDKMRAMRKDKRSKAANK